MTDTARFALRDATQAAHERLDSSLATLNLSDREDYAAFLVIQSAVLPALERQLAEGGIGDLVSGWDAGRRTDALLQDLADLNVVPAASQHLPALSDEPRMLGAAYVLEGSRLGGQLLSRQVDQGFPNAFFEAGRNLIPWTGLIAELERLLYTPERLDLAKSAANDVFHAYFKSAGEFGLRV